MAATTPSVSAPRLLVPPSVEQTLKLTRYQLREYLRSRRFVALAGIIVAIGAILTTVVAHYRGGIIASNLGFYGSFWGGGVDIVIVLSAVFFGGDAIAGEFQNKTGYFLMGLPVRRTVVYIGKYLAAFAASFAMLLLYLAILLANGAYYFHLNALPWQLGLSLLLAFVYLAAVLGVTFLFSSLFKTSAYGFVLTAILFLFGFTLLGDLISGLVNIQPWMIISYASSTIESVFAPGVDWGLKGTQSVTFTMVGRMTLRTTTYTAGIAQGIVLMVAYFIESFALGLYLFEREEFT
jgi:ABC-2 type transport system permease protein